MGILYDQADGFVVRGEESGATDGFTLHPGYRRIRYGPMNSRIQFMAADEKTGDGPIPTLVLLDELHRHRDLRLYRTLRGKLAKRGGKMGVISTRGEPGSEFELLLERILEMATTLEVSGAFTRAVSPGVILHQWAVPAGGDTNDLQLVKAANPLKSMTLEKLADKRAASDWIEHHWQRMVCNRPTRDVECWLGPNADALWRGLEQPYQFVAGAPTWAGVDMALKHDTSAVVLIQQRPDGRYHATSRIWTPTPDTEVDVTDIMQHIREVKDRYDLKAVSYDPRFFDLAAKMLDRNDKINMVEVPQSVPRMSTIVSFAYKALMEGRITHDQDPDFTRQVLNAIPAYHERTFTLEKRKSHGKIDAAVALCLAFDQALRFEGKAKPELWVGSA